MRRSLALAVAVLVSEETGGIRLAVNGKLTKEIAPDQLRNSLRSLMLNTVALTRSSSRKRNLQIS